MEEGSTLWWIEQHRLRALERDEARSKLESAQALLRTAEGEVANEHDAFLGASRRIEDLKLQVESLKAVLYAEIKGEPCGDDCAMGGYRSCMGCDNRIKKALGQPIKFPGIDKQKGPDPEEESKKAMAGLPYEKCPTCDFPVGHTEICCSCEKCDSKGGRKP